MSRSKVDPKKEEQERLSSILQSLLKEEENKYCADCNAKTPRWAAWNLGVFICITCAGIHRNLGVHISKVRSVTLDVWTPEQVQSMRVMGNERAKKVYEHSLPPTFRRSTSVHQLEQFIRSKYDQKRFMIKDFVYPKIDINDLPKPGAPLKNTLVIRDAVNMPSINSPPAVSANSNSVSPLPDLLNFSAPAKPAAPSNASLDLFADDPFGASQPTTSDPPSNDLDDMFGNFVSATPSEAENANNLVDNNFASFPPSVAPASTETSEPLSNELMGLSMNEPSSNIQAVSDEKKSNADILSLFSNSTSNAPPQLVAPGGFAAFGIQAAPTGVPTASQPSLNIFDAQPQATQSGVNSLMGLNFSAPAGNVPQQPSFGTSMMNTMPNVGSSFPNPFGAQSSMPTSLFSGSIPPQPTQSASGFSTPSSNKSSNSFADLSIGKVMGTLNNMGSKQNAPVMKPATNGATATPAPAASNSMCFDDLLGL